MSEEFLITLKAIDETGKVLLCWHLEPGETHYLGNSYECQIDLRYYSVQRKHLSIFVSEKGSVSIQDFGVGKTLLNSTELNVNSPSAMNSGDLLWIGKYPWPLKLTKINYCEMIKEQAGGNIIEI